MTNTYSAKQYNRYVQMAKNTAKYNTHIKAPFFIYKLTYAYKK